MADQIKPNNYAWAEDGRKVYVTHITTEGYYVVEGMEAQVYGDEVYEERGSMWVTAKLYAQPPKPVIDEQIEKAKAELEEVREKYREVTNAVYNAERENKDRLAKLAKYKGLELLEDFIDGKITHVVWTEYDGALIKTIEDALTYYEDGSYGRHRTANGFKLVTLFGNSKGDLSWRVSQYRDGSGGSDQEIIPCSSYDDAVAKRNEILHQRMASMLDLYRKDKSRDYLVVKVADNFEKAGLEIPAEAQVIVKTANEVAAAKLKENLAKQKQELEAKLAALEVAS
ncbi:hypothetical protein ACTJJ8_10125 [Agrobacterium radiobacter]|uniref:hypothetical protein n=1 Tax=Agrobacterium radiobacter TaxID=362 RepID=UPI003F84EE9D